MVSLNEKQELKIKQIKDLRREDFFYDLPKDRIAKFPLLDRASSKLLIYKSGQISHSVFRDIGNHLPEGSLLVFNDTKVVQARLIFEKTTGAKIEVFCLGPSHDHIDISLGMQQQKEVAWRCLVGNKRKWKPGQVLEVEKVNADGKIKLKVNIIKDEGKEFVIRFSWKPGILSFAEILELFGHVPLPPYLGREEKSSDRETYQTVYAEKEGAVAAPTAGLHFTEELLQSLKEKGIDSEKLTLYVSSGTFKPVDEEKVIDHPMHEEQIAVSRRTIENLLNFKREMVAVGTTSLRVLESLYWLGLKLKEGLKIEKVYVSKLDPYKFNPADLPGRAEVLKSLLTYMDKKGIETLTGKTQLFILPGYHFQMVDGLITNYHLPGSTLLMLIAALVGDDWKKIYGEALKKGYRFLSYGDSSLLWKRTD